MNTQKNKLEYDQYVAFINRETELNRLRKFVNKEPSEMLFLHGPKSSGKTTLLYKFFDQIQKEQKLDVKFFKLSVEVLKGLERGELDPFEIMKREFIKLTKKGIKPVIIIDELQATVRDFVNLGIGKDEVDELLRDIVRNNILYFDPIEAVYYPQARSFLWGTRLYFESMGLNKKKKS